MICPKCYPVYQEYNREVMGSDDENDFSNMDMSGRVRVSSLFLTLLVSCTIEIIKS